MDIEKAINAIKDWYEGEHFQILGLVDEPDLEASNGDYEQSETFLEVRGMCNGDADHGYQGFMYFQMPCGKWIETDFNG